MKPISALAISLALCLALITVGGCGYTVTTTVVDPPKLGPQVATGRAAQMGEVRDMRSWPQEDSGQTIANVRIYAPEITATLRQGLVERGLFTALPQPAGVAGSDPRLMMTLRAFKLDTEGFNAWVVPHLLLDGALLPLFTAVQLGTFGQVDMGGYVFPSTSMATTLNLSADWKEPGLDTAALTRSYSITLPLGAVSQRRLIQEMGDSVTYGSAVGRAEGLKALDKLLDKMTRDPYWAYLGAYIRLAKAEAAMTRYQQAASAAKAQEGQTPEQSKTPMTVGGQPKVMPTAYRPYSPTPAVAVDKFRNAQPQGVTSARLTKEAPGPPQATPTLPQMAAQVRALLPVLEPLPFTPDEVGVLTDGYLEAESRANIVNAMRARRLGLDDPKELPEKDRLTEKDAEALYDDPRVARAEVQAALAERVLNLAAKVITPDTAQEPPADALARQELITALAAALKDKPQLQVLLTKRADRAVRGAWPPMRELLSQVGSEYTQRYLTSRES